MASLRLLAGLVVLISIGLCGAQLQPNTMTLPSPLQQPYSMFTTPVFQANMNPLLYPSASNFAHVNTKFATAAALTSTATAGPQVNYPYPSAQQQPQYMHELDYQQALRAQQAMWLQVQMAQIQRVVPQQQQQTTPPVASPAIPTTDQSARKPVADLPASAEQKPHESTTEPYATDAITPNESLPAESPSPPATTSVPVAAEVSTSSDSTPTDPSSSSWFSNAVHHARSFFVPPGPPPLGPAGPIGPLGPEPLKPSPLGPGPIGPAPH